MKNNAIINWIIRCVKGVFIGTGFILPGVSGGALAAIFGLYERIISFVAHLNRNFLSNLFFFIPIGIGMLSGIVLLSYPLSFFLENYKAPVMWCFIGCVVGTLPSLWKQAGKKGRNNLHIALVFIFAAVGYFSLSFVEKIIDSNVPQNFGTWILAGVIIALGVLVPGLSPSNFLLYMGMYESMVDAFKTLDIMVLLPIAIGGGACMLAFSKLLDVLFSKAYALLFHIVFGVVIASTMIIVPLDYNYLSLGALICAVVFVLGFLLGLWMSGLEEKYKT